MKQKIEKKYYNKEKTAYILKIYDSLLGPYYESGHDYYTDSRLGLYYVEYKYKGKWYIPKLSKWRDVCLAYQVGTNGIPTGKPEIFYSEENGACDCYDLWEGLLDD